MKLSSSLLIFLSIFLFFFFCIVPQAAIAQPGPPDPSGDPDLPIDGGVGILLTAGVLYGVKMVRNERNKKLNKLP